MNLALKAVQGDLAALGYDVGEIDGITGPQTAKALSQAILDGKISLTNSGLIALKKTLLETPTRRTINDVYGKPIYKEGPKAGAITITNASEWRKNFTQVSICACDNGKEFQLTVNRRIAVNLCGAFAEIRLYNRTLPECDRWQPKRIDSYAPRHNRWDSTQPLSVHTWAAAIDIDPLTNGIGMKTDIPSWAIHILQAWGAVWGGDWTNYPDPMHFQWMR